MKPINTDRGWRAELIGRAHPYLRFEQRMEGTTFWIDSRRDLRRLANAILKALDGKEGK